MAVKYAVDKLKVFYEDVAKPTIVVGFESILPRITSNHYIKSSGYFGVLTGSSLTSEWIHIDASDNIIKIKKGSTDIEIILPTGKYYTPFYLAHYITQRVKTESIECEYINGKFIFRCYEPLQSQYTLSDFSIYSVGAYAEFGFSSPTISSEQISRSYNGSVSFGVDDVYKGLDNETYYLKVSGNSLYSVTPNSNNIYKGTVSVTGNLTASTNVSYTVTINTSTGNSAGSGYKYCPTFSVVSTEGDNTPTSQEILFYNVWYNIGNYGVKIKFSEHHFGNNDSFTVSGAVPATADGTNNTADTQSVKFVVITKDTISAPTSLVGNSLSLPKGLNIIFGAGTFTKGDTFLVRALGGDYLEIPTLNMGTIWAGTETTMFAVRFMAKQGVHGFKWCKVGIHSVGPLQNYKFGGSYYTFGTLGKYNSKNTLETVPSFIFNDVKSSFYSYLDFWEEKYYINIGCGVLFTDPWYVSFSASDLEATANIDPEFKIYYSFI